MFCPKCGKAVPDGAMHCPNCGEAVQVTQAANPQQVPAVQPPKKKGKKKWIIIGVVVVILAIMMFGGDSDSSSPSDSTLASNDTTQTDTAQPAEDSASSDSKNDEKIASALEQYQWIAENASTTFTIPDSAAAFITAHPDFFPGNSSNTGAMSDATNYDVTYPMLAKSAKKYSDKLINIYGYVTKIEETDDGTVTYIHIMDADGNSYIAYYLGSIEIYEEDTVTGYLLPFDNIQFENIGGGYTNAVAAAAAYIEKQEIAE